MDTTAPRPALAGQMLYKTALVVRDWSDERRRAEFRLLVRTLYRTACDGYGLTEAQVCARFLEVWWTVPPAFDPAGAVFVQVALYPPDLFESVRRNRLLPPPSPDSRS